jgi:hypothetical protein
MATVVEDRANGAAVGTTSVANVTKRAIASGAIPARSLTYIKSDGTLALADATTEGKEATGFVSSAYADGELATYKMIGNVIEGLSGLTPGSVYFMSTTPGALATSTAASSYVAGNVRMEVGTALSATDLLFKPNTPITL